MGGLKQPAEDVMPGLEEPSAVAERLRPWVERARRFSGWAIEDEIRPRRLGPEAPWDYLQRARELVRAAERVLDLGTGGGEVFAAVCEGFEGLGVATEEWHVNVPLAAARLRSRGVQVIRASSLRLPFQDESFNLVLDRHEELSTEEVSRVLRPGGRLLTQQVHAGNWKEMDRFIPRRTRFPPHFRLYQEGLRAARMQILDAREHEVRTAYPDLGAFVFMLCIAPWEVPDFDPLGRDLEALRALERACSAPEGLVLIESRYIIEAQKAAS
jgi:SAM-dependent methyltransferase